MKLVLFILVIALAWQFTPVKHWIEAATVFIGALPWAPAWLILAFVLAALALVPLTLLQIQCGILLGAKLGLGVVIPGIFIASSLGFLFGRRAHFGLGERLPQITRLLRKHDVLPIALFRLFPVAPFMLVNVAAGSTICSYRAFIVGSMLGITPGAVVLVVFGSSLLQLLRS